MMVGVREEAGDLRGEPGGLNSFLCRLLNRSSHLGFAAVNY